MSLLKTAISGTETSIFQIGRLTLERSGAIMLEHVFPPTPHHSCGGGRHKESRGRQPARKSETKKRGFPWQTICIFFGSTGCEPFHGDFPLNAHWEREPCLEAVGPGQDTCPPPHQLRPQNSTGCSQVFSSLFGDH